MVSYLRGKEREVTESKIDQEETPEVIKPNPLFFFK